MGSDTRSPSAQWAREDVSSSWGGSSLDEQAERRPASTAPVDCGTTLERAGQMRGLGAGIVLSKQYSTHERTLSGLQFAVEDRFDLPPFHAGKLLRELLGSHAVIEASEEPTRARGLANSQEPLSLSKSRSTSAAFFHLVMRCRLLPFRIVFHVLTTPRISPSSPSVSCSNSRMSARISSSVRIGSGL